jgi:hypothetical protein
MLAVVLGRGLDVAPLISRGGRTTPGGALISSSAAMASPFVADGAMLDYLWTIRSRRVVDGSPGERRSRFVAMR